MAFQIQIQSALLYAKASAFLSSMWSYPHCQKTAILPCLGKYDVRAKRYRPTWTRAGLNDSVELGRDVRVEDLTERKFCASVMRVLEEVNISKGSGFDGFSLI